VVRIAVNEGTDLVVDPVGESALAGSLSSAEAARAPGVRR
jgi:hypothetical protein